MRPVIQENGATGPSDWIMVNYLQRSFNIGYNCTVGGATAPSMTYSLEGGYWSGNYDTEVHITRSTTTATLKFNAINGPNGSAWVNHGLAVGDSLIINSAGAPLDGTYRVASVTDSRTVTYTVANSGVTVSTPGTFVTRIFVRTGLAGVTGVTGATAGSITTPINFLRSNIATFGSGALTLSFDQGMGP
jgi:hypothetical protein